MNSIVRRGFYIINNIKIRLTQKGVNVAFNSRIRPPYLLDEPSKIGKNTYFKGHLGAYSYIGENCRISANIGKFCSISSNVRVVDATHPTTFVSSSPVFYSVDRQCNSTFADKKYFDDSLSINNENIACEIGNDVWIGENVMIKGGVHIGTGACIAMGAVVVKDVEPYAIVGGVPAKVIRKRFTENQIKKLLQSRWWDMDETYIKRNFKRFFNIEDFYEMIDE